MYSEEHYDEQERKLAQWARDDAMTAMRRALNAQRRGDSRAAMRYAQTADQYNSDAEYHENRI